MEKPKLNFYFHLNGDNYKKYFIHFGDQNPVFTLRKEYNMFSKNIKTGALIEKIKNGVLYVKTFWTNKYVSDMKKNYNLENKIETNAYFHNEVVIFSFETEEDAFYFSFKTNSDFKPVKGIKHVKE